MHILYALICLFSALTGAGAIPTSVFLNSPGNVSQALFDSLEELARIVDISYCVGTTGIQRPFRCLGRCSDFEGFDLVSSWNTGPLLSDSCGYIALSHPPHPKRVIIAFRGTYSLANTVVDLSTNPSEYLPFPEDGGDSVVCPTSDDSNGETSILPQLLNKNAKRSSKGPVCTNCTVHAGFMNSWRNTRCIIIPLLEKALAENPGYQLTLVGHSLGGAVAALASLEFLGRGWEPQVTTFGEPRVGNQAFSTYLDKRFNLDDQLSARNTYRRVTHVSDPVPLLPLEEWGYRMHAGEVFISKANLQPSRSDLVHCVGDQDPNCISGASASNVEEMRTADEHGGPLWFHDENMWKVPNRYKLWELFFAHRDYFWRLGVCAPGGDPRDWWRNKYPHTEPDHDL